VRSILKISAEPTRDPLLSLDRLTLRFGNAVALDEVSFDVARGEIVSLLGPSGSGKSSLLRLVAGIDRPTLGRIRIEGADVADPACFVEAEHRNVGMVFQDYALFPHLTVADNVAFGLAGRRRADIDRTVSELLERVGLSRYAGSYPHALSGGERQRVALARALAPKPRLLLMDEPFSSLDRQLRSRVCRDTISVLRDLGTTAIVVTHDPAEAIAIADRIALLRAGRLQQYGSAQSLYQRPATAFTARFFGDVNELTGLCFDGGIATPFGCFAAPHLPERSAARVCIRPHDLRVSGRTTDVRGRVLTSEFLGGVERVVVEIGEPGQPVSLHVSPGAPFAPGDTIHLDVDRSRVVVVADDEHESTI
jgi:iron(III) transport system ATP-binding protein